MGRAHGGVEVGNVISCSLFCGGICLFEVGNVL